MRIVVVMSGSAMLRLRMPMSTATALLFWVHSCRNRRIARRRSSDKFLPAVFAAKIECLSIALNVERGRFVHRHSANGVFGHIFLRSSPSLWIVSEYGIAPPFHSSESTAIPFRGGLAKHIPYAGQRQDRTIVFALLAIIESDGLVVCGY